MRGIQENLFSDSSYHSYEAAPQGEAVAFFEMVCYYMVKAINNRCFI